MTSFWDHLYQYAQELEDLLRGPAARSFRRLWEEQQELHSLEEQALFRAGLSMGLALGGRVRDLE